MGMFATLAGERFKKCPKCGQRAEWQSKNLSLNYKGREIDISTEGGVELDENMNGDITSWCCGKQFGGCGVIVYFSIEQGVLLESYVSEETTNY